MFTEGFEKLHYILEILKDIHICRAMQMPWKDFIIH